MVPRVGEQHLDTPYATEAENTNLYSGELRPLHKPTLAHVFCQPGDACFYGPKDPEPPIIVPPPPPNCVAPVIENTDLTRYEDSCIGDIWQFQVIINSDASGPLQYRWYKNGNPLSGNYDSILTYTVTAADTGAVFSVLVIGPCGEAFREIGLGGEVTDCPTLDGCEPYACDAFEQALLLEAESFWPFTTGAINPEPDVIGSRDMAQGGSGGGPVFDDATGPIFGASGCSGEIAVTTSEATGTHYYQYAGGTNALRSTGFNGLGIVTAYTNGDQKSVMDMRYYDTGGNAYLLGLFVDIDGSGNQRIYVDDGLFASPCGLVSIPGTSQTSITAWFMEVELVSPSNMTVKVYRNFEPDPLCTWTNNTPISGTWDFDNASNYLQFYRTNGTATFGHGFHTRGATGANIAAMKLAFERNFTAYTPPSYCFPEGCEPYYCDAFSTAIEIDPAVIAHWPMNDPYYRETPFQPMRQPRHNL